ncbi:MAG: hypothetical protein WA414_11625 [Acidobacteriaceae bacterium]
MDILNQHADAELHTLASSRRNRAIAALGLTGVGLAGGVLRALLLHRGLLDSALFGAAAGLVFSLFLSKRVASPGAGLIWGLGSAFAAWLLMAARLGSGISSSGTTSMLLDQGVQFPELAADLLCLGAPLGLALGVYGAWLNRARLTFRWGRAMVAGGMAGIFGGLVFGYWMFAGNFFPLLGGLDRLPGHFPAVVLQFSIALLLGALFGILFQHDVHSYGACMGWGIGFSILWWFAGPLTIFPAVTGQSIDWSAQNAANLFGPLIGHILYGLILGISYATFDRFWTRLFVQADPLNRRPEGPGLHIVRSLQWGAVAGFAGGLVSSPIMIATGVLSRVAGTETHLSATGGLAVHLMVSTLIGMSFGLLFREEASNLADGIMWGCLFGLIWWYAGPVTLLPLILTGQIDWRPAALEPLLPALIGHLLYGSSTAFVFLLFERRHQQRTRGNPRIAMERLVEPLQIGSAAPALWMLVIGLGFILPLMLSYP